MTLQRVDEMTEPPVVGQVYLVPCVFIAGPPGSRKQLRDGTGPKGCEGMLPGWWPVIGPQHEDAAIFEFPHQHWHLDLRFLGKVQVANRMFGREEGTEAERAARLLSRPLTNHGALPAPEYRPRRCMREQPDWNDFLAATHRTRRPDNMAKLDRVTAIKGQTLKTCMVCPHRGLPLGSMPVINGVITCPGHGLRWRADTGEVVRTPGPVRSPALGREPVRVPLWGDNRRCVEFYRRQA